MIFCVSDHTNIQMRDFNDMNRIYCYISYSVLKWYYHLKDFVSNDDYNNILYDKNPKQKTILILAVRVEWIKETLNNKRPFKRYNEFSAWLIKILAFRTTCLQIET